MAASAKRNARIEITADNQTGPGLNSARRDLNMMRREQERANREAQRAAKDQRRAIAEGASRANRGIGSLATSAVGFGTSMLKAAGMPGLDEMVSDVFDANRELTRFQIDAQLSGDQTSAFDAELMKVSNSLGVARKSLIEGAHAYQILTGDAKGAIASSELFGEVMNASGASMQDIASVAASMNKNLGLDPAQFRAGFDVILSMGHKGSVELRDLAGELSSIAPMFSKFGESEGGAEHLSKLVATLQVVRHGFGSASEAATGLQSLMAGLERKHAKLESAGVRVFDIDPKTKQRTTRDFFEIIDDIKKHKIDMVDLLGDLGRVEGVKAAIELVSEKGNAEMHELYNTALNTDQVSKDNAAFMQSSTGKLQKTWEILKNTVAEALNAERVEAFADAMVKAANWIMQAAAAIDHFATGGKVNDRANNFTEQMFEASGISDVAISSEERSEKHDAMIAYAQSIVEGRGIGDPELAEAAGMRKSHLSIFSHIAGVDEYGDTEGRLASAHKILESEGIEHKYRAAYVDPWQGNTSVRAGAYDPKAMPSASEIADGFARSLATLLPDALKNVNLTVKADSNAIATTGANAPISRSTRTR